jgi:hypothetical protein
LDSDNSQMDDIPPEVNSFLSPFVYSSSWCSTIHLEWKLVSGICNRI